MSHAYDRDTFPAPQDDWSFALAHEAVAKPAPATQSVGAVGKRLNPWLSMWTQPRQTVRQVLDTNPHRNVLLYTVLAGVAASFTAIDDICRAIGEVQQVNAELGQNGVDPKALEDVFANIGPELILILIGAVTLMSILGSLATVYLNAPLLAMIGRWLGGVGDSVALRVPLAYCGLLTVWLIPLVLADGMTNMVPALAVMRPPIQLALLMANLWIFCQLCRAISEAHQFSEGKALLTLILPGLLCGVAVLVLILVAAIALM